MLVATDCPLEVTVGLAPAPLTLLEPVINRGNRGRWKKGSLVPKYALKGSEPCCGLTEGVLGVLSPGEELAPAVLMVVAEGSQEPTYLLDLPLCLPVHLWLVSRGQTDVQT